MILILNILFGVLAFFVVRLLCMQMGVDMRVATVIGVIFGIIVYLLNLAGHVIR